MRSNSQTRPAITMVSSGQSLTRNELDNQTRQFANVLSTLNVVPGMRVAILLANQVEYVVAVMGSQLAGCDYLSLNHHANLQEQLVLIDRLQPSVIVVSSQFFELAKGLDEHLPSTIQRVLVGARKPGWESFQDLMANSSTEYRATEQTGRSFFLSGGSTGHPKIVVRPAADRRPERTFGIELYDNDVALVTAPLYHTMPMGWVISSVELGIPVVICERWDSIEVLQSIERYRITLLTLIPTTMRRLVSLPRHVRGSVDLSSLRFVRHGAAPCSIDTKRAFMEWLPAVEVSEIYGMSEAIGRCGIGRKEWLQRPGSVGRPMPGYRVIIRDETGKELSPHQPGIVWFKRDDGERMYYLGEPEETAACYNEHGEGTGWDIGYVDEEGYLFLVDRLKRMLIVGGVNIYPAKIEAALLGHPAVADAYVAGRPDGDLGQVPIAAVQLVAGANSDELRSILTDHCRTLLGGSLATPRDITFVERLPREPTSKIRHSEVLRLLKV